MSVTWWCAARGEPWDGGWQAYPGVWIFAILVGLIFSRVAVRGDAGWRRAMLPLSVVLLWVTLDWPIGPLGAGYLAWIHSIQFLMLAMIIPPVLLLSVDRGRVDALLMKRPLLRGALTRSTQPLFAMVLFAMTMVFTHLPRVVDGLMVTQLGAFALDLAWLLAGLIFWWPVIVRLPERAHFPPLMQMLYLFFGTQPHLYVAMWLLGADYPSYATYELAPRITAVSAIIDQQIAGAVMLGFGATYVIGAITVLYFRWMARESVSA
jgi:cytochrome c oxidase assembly factor CtaG